MKLQVLTRLPLQHKRMGSNGSYGILLGKKDFDLLQEAIIVVRQVHY
jgi:hypothetical protein